MRTNPDLTYLSLRLREFKWNMCFSVSPLWLDDTDDMIGQNSTAISHDTELRAHSPGYQCSIGDFDEA